MVADMVENIRKGEGDGYSIYPPFSCIVFLIGYRREDVKVIDPKTNEEMFL